jgi:hypothetical protein
VLPAIRGNRAYPIYDGDARLGHISKVVTEALKKTFEVRVQLRWAMKNALVPAPPFG